MAAGDAEGLGLGVAADRAGAGDGLAGGCAARGRAGAGEAAAVAVAGAAGEGVADAVPLPRLHAVSTSADAATEKTQPALIMARRFFGRPIIPLQQARAAAALKRVRA